jgi:membrane-bound lytic murein transglycosylase B
VPPGSPQREALLRELTAPRDGGLGEVALTRGEAEALLSDPRAELVYGEKTISIVAPSMQQRHRQEHLDLMKLFLKPERVQAAAQFARDRAATLSAVEQRTGVDREVIIGILMWESKLGTITGDYRAFNVFTSQQFFIDEANAIALGRADEKAVLDEAAQRRRVESIRERARKNLLALARQCKGRGIDVLEVKGSWAGALGFPQFMPASLRFADDGNGDGKIDLFDMDDSIASVGRYLGEHGFKQSARRAVWDYNHEDAYVEGVLAFAAALEALAADGGLPDAGR